jgi:hypothetical protein
MAGMLSELQDFSRSRLGFLELSLEQANVAEICREVIAEIAAADMTCNLQFVESGDTATVVDRISFASDRPLPPTRYPESPRQYASASVQHQE